MWMACTIVTVSAGVECNQSNFGRGRKRRASTREETPAHIVTELGIGAFGLNNPLIEQAGKRWIAVRGWIVHGAYRCIGLLEHVALLVFSEK